MTSAATLASTVAELKPRLRGWLHAYAAAISIATGAAMVAVAAAVRGGPAATTTAIYSATVTLLFGTSALYHRINWGPSAHRLMKRLDHSMIFVFIAGTYTPIAVLTLPGWVAIFVLPDLLHNAGVAAFVLILAGGVVYTIGGVVYALKRPNPIPGVLGFHEVFHLCTLVAALCHYIAIWLAVFN
jgi:hemolysin III